MTSFKVKNIHIILMAGILITWFLNNSDVSFTAPENVPTVQQNLNWSSDQIVQQGAWTTFVFSLPVSNSLKALLITFSSPVIWGKWIIAQLDKPGKKRGLDLIGHFQTISSSQKESTVLEKNRLEIAKMTFKHLTLNSNAGKVSAIQKTLVEASKAQPKVRQASEKVFFDVLDDLIKKK